MFNILTYGKKNNISIGLPSLNKEEWGNTWKGYLDKYDLFNFVSLKKLKLESKYIIFLTFYGHFKSNVDFSPLYDCQEWQFKPNQSDHRLSTFYMPDRVREDSQNGLVHWVIDYNTECDHLDSRSDIDFHRMCQLLHAVPENITLITGGETISKLGNSALTSAKKLGYNCITGHDLYDFINIRKGQSNDQFHNEYSSQKIKDIINGVTLKYKSLCYNRLPRQHRTVIVAHILKNGYRNNCLYSLGTFPDQDRWHWIEDFPELANEIKKLQNGSEIYPHIREELVSLRVNQAHSIGWNHGLNSYFQLVTETTPNNNKIPFITEKSLKPFAMLQPFLQYGPKDNIKVLRMYGYQMFDEWIDHSYDDEDDDIKRLRMVLKEFDRLQEIPNEVWTKMLQEMLSQLLHNNKLVKRPPIYDFTSQLIPILAKFMEKSNV